MEYYQNEAREIIYGLPHSPDDFLGIFNETHEFRATMHDVVRYSDHTNVYNEHDIFNEKECEDFLAAVPANNEHGSKPTSTCRLIVLHRATPDTMLKLVKTCGIDSTTLLALTSHRYYFQAGQRRGSSSSFGLTFEWGRQVWVYDWERCAVRGIMISPTSKMPIGNNLFERFRNDIMHPLALGFMALEFTRNSLVGSFNESLGELDKIERQTGHTSRKDIDPLDESWKHENPDLSRISRAISHLHSWALVYESWLERMAAILKEMETVNNSTEYSRPGPRTALSWPDSQEWQASIEWQAHRISGSFHEIRLFLARIRVQNNVIFNLINQRDAEQSILLAKSSTLLARAAAEDSSSMKAITLLTMSVLPATFFAALFSMPLLDWSPGAGSVIQPEFWIYLAFTLPATAIVFCMWAFLVKVWPRLRRKPRQTDVTSSDYYELSKI